MRAIVLMCIGWLTAGMASAQQKAVTDTGEEVILYEDGTWKYQKEIQKVEKEIPVNPKSYKKKY